MAEFKYEAVAATGIKSTGSITADTEMEVMSMLDARGLYPVKIEKAKEPRASLFGGRVRPRTMAQFYSQLADLLHAGVPLLRSLDILDRQCSSPALQSIIRDIRARVADGASLGEAMSRHPKAFTELAVSMVRAGQEGAFLEDALKRIADFTDKQEDLKAKVIGALAYPVFLGVVGILVLNVVVIFFVPLFEPIFARLRERNEMPALSQMVITLSNAMRNPLVWIIGVPLFIGGLVLFTRWRRTPAGRLMFDTVKLKLPGAGKIFLNLALARFTRVQGTLLQNGVPLLQALRIAKDSTGNRVLANAIDQAAENVTEGESLAAPLRQCPFIPRDIVEMVAVGEESNTLEKVLLDIADTLERRTTRQLELFVRLLEPVMLLVIAGFTLIIVAGLMLPVFKMSSVVQ